jgi:hypothetical protein
MTYAQDTSPPRHAHFEARREALRDEAACGQLHTGKYTSNSQPNQNHQYDHDTYIHNTTSKQAGAQLGERAAASAFRLACVCQ